MRIFFKLVLILLILGSGVFIAKKLIESKPPAKRRPVSIGAPLVDVVTAAPRTEQVVVSAMGTVIPAKEVAVQPQVSGHIAEISPELVPGGLFMAGDVLLRIDDRDYQIAVELAKAEVEKALTELKLEKGKQAIAEREWELLGKDIPTTKEGRELALRKPHLKKVLATVESARSSLKKAKLDVERTVVKAAFNAFVKEKQAELGQFSAPGTKLATLVGTDEFWVQVSVPVSKLSYISLPVTGGKDGAWAKVIQEGDSPDSRIIRQGRVVRLLGDLDPVGRMVRLLVSVKDPLGIMEANGETEMEANGETEESEAGTEDGDAEDPWPETEPGNPAPSSLPFLLGAYVNVEIQGPILENVFVIPRKALREEDRIWLLTDDKKLAFRKAKVEWRRKEDVLVRGLEPGDRIILSRISAPVEGMSLRSEGK